ncbi:unnamed protein product [Oncorhynchus mykiss]|uniref:MADF domain-containing protein n=1 Tax=Oncorhynchus mykiss TaxID=8022 RepID=A0A060ZVP2_ONCMY|nr:unnamed protein product [Oncorhynchus mykiss]
MLGNGLAYHVHVYVEEDCRRKWRGLRDRYQRARRVEKDKRSGSAASGQQPWHFCHILSFLDQFIVPRATSGNFTARPSTTSSTSVVATGASRPSTSSTNATITSTGGVRPSTTSSRSMTSTGGVRPSTTSSRSMTSTGGVRPSTTSSTSMTTTGAAMEDDEMQEAPLDLGPPEFIINLTEVTTEDLVEQDVAVKRNREKQREKRRGTTSHQASSEVPAPRSTQLISAEALLPSRREGCSPT